MASITAALVAAAVLGMWFTPTRWIGISATAALCFFHPGLAALVVVFAAGVFFTRNHP